MVDSQNFVPALTSVAEAPQSLLARYGLVPAPAKRRISRPIDLGDYHEDYRGSFVIFNLDAGLDNYQKLAEAQSANVDGIQTLSLMSEWLRNVVIVWNLTVVNDRGEVELLPQPAEGGATRASPALLGPLAQAFNEAIQPPKTGATP